MIKLPVLKHLRVENHGHFPGHPKGRGIVSDFEAGRVNGRSRKWRVAEERPTALDTALPYSRAILDFFTRLCQPTNVGNHAGLAKMVARFSNPPLVRC
jgi:hypothetical protein